MPPNPTPAPIRDVIERLERAEGAKDRPVIFSALMVRALLEGRKTQTRRLATSPLAKMQPRDRLWVREAWAPLSALTHNDAGSTALIENGFYRADAGIVDGEISRWTPSIHMPRLASRLTLLVTEVRRERLGDITERDAEAEGVDLAGRAITARLAFAQLWNSLHGNGAWEADPEVVALTFKVAHANIDDTAALRAILAAGDGGRS